MSPILLLITVLSVIMVAGILMKFEIGISAYLLYFFCVPLVTLYCFTYQFGLNTVVFLALIVYLIKYQSINKNALSLIAPFFYLYIFWGLLIPFHSADTPLIFQFDSWRYGITGLVVPFIITNICAQNKTNVRSLYIAIYIAVFINTIYTLYLTTSFGYNPYIQDIIGTLRQTSDKDFSFLEQESIRVFGYISACFLTVTNYGAFLISVIVLVFDDYLKKKSVFKLIALILLGICILICGSRSVLYTLILLICLFLCLKKNFKVLAYTAIIAGVAILLIDYYLPTYTTFLMSFNSDEIAGSTTDMRITQYLGCFQEVVSNPLGNGYNWTNWYKLNHGGSHPVMKGFESLPMQILCEGGIPGLIVWIVVGINLIKLVLKKFSTDLITRDSIILLLSGYLILTFFTGDYGTLQVFLIMYALIVGKSFSRDLV